LDQNSKDEIICTICDNANSKGAIKCEFCGASLGKNDDFDSFFGDSSGINDDSKEKPEDDELDSLIGDSSTETDNDNSKPEDSDLSMLIEDLSTEPDNENVKLKDDLDSHLEDSPSEKENGISKRKIFGDFARRWESKEQGEERREPPQTCELCGSTLKLPTYKCISCGGHFGKEDIKGDTDDIHNCPTCDSLLIQTPKDEFDKLVHNKECLDCGFSREEVLDLDEKEPSFEMESEKELASESLEDVNLDTIDMDDFDEIPSKEDITESNPEELDCPECGTKVNINNDACPKCGLSFWDFDKQPEIKLEHSLAEETIEEEVFECPLCNGDVAESDTKCKSCGVEFTGGDEPPDEALDKSIVDLENFIESTVSEFEVEDVKEEEFLSSIKELEDFEEQQTEFIDNAPNVAAAQDHKSILDSSIQESDIQQPRHRKVLAKPVKTPPKNTCPLCEITVEDGGNYCTKCGMISLSESAADERQINEFLIAIKKVIKVQKTHRSTGEIEKQLQMVESELRNNLGDENLWFQRGLLLDKIGSSEKAIKSFDTVLKLNPKHKKVWIAKANILGSEDNLDEAAKCYQKVLELTILEYPESTQQKSKEEPIKRPTKRPVKRPVSPGKIQSRLSTTKGTSPVKMGLSRGLTNGLTNGLTRKKRGLVNGLTNGRTNGLRRSKSGMVNGLTNGKINGITRRKPGMVNGLTNGKINGLTRSRGGIINGLTNGKVNGLNRARLGMVNGLTNGLTNGITNGLTNGLTRGIRALKFGITNGLTNGNGITNGIGGQHALLKERSSKGRIVTVAALIILIIIVPYFILATHTAETAIEIDGRFADWGGVNNLLDSQEAQPFNPNIDIVDYWIDDRYMELSFYLRVEGRILAGESGGEKHMDTAYIFIDSDSDMDTGFYIKGMGADYMLEIYGWDAIIVKSSIYYYINITQDWNLWEEMGSVTTKITDSELETQIPFSTLKITDNDPLDILFYMQSWDGLDDFADTIISNKKGVLSVTQKGVAPDVISGINNRLLQLNFKAFDRNIRVHEIQAKRAGMGSDNDITDIRLEDENGNSIAQGEITNGIVTFLPDLQINKAASVTYYVVVDVNDNTPFGNCIGFQILNKQNIVTNLGTVHLDRKKPDEGFYDNSYIGTIP
jgi:tetratricopeptide (TPR) repeat protein